MNDTIYLRLCAARQSPCIKNKTEGESPQSFVSAQNPKLNYVYCLINFLTFLTLL